MPQEPPIPTTLIYPHALAQAAQALRAGRAGEFVFLDAASALIGAKPSKATQRSYRADVTRWWNWCIGQKLDPQRATLVDSTAYREYLLASGLANPSVARALACLSWLYGTLLRNKPPIVGGNPFSHTILPWPKVSPEGKTKAIATAFAEAILQSAAPSPRDFALLRLLYDTGARRAEIASLEWARVKLEAREIVVVLKGGREAASAIVDETVGALRRWFTVSGAIDARYVFPAARGEGHLHPDTVNKILAAHAKAAGAGDVHPHSFRATWITDAYDAGLPEYEIQAGAHHSDPKMTRRYDRGRRGLGAAEAVAAHRRKK